jgi:hypothetical protein
MSAGLLVAVLLKQPHGRADQLLPGLLALAFSQTRLVSRGRSSGYLHLV